MFAVCPLSLPSFWSLTLPLVVVCLLGLFAIAAAVSSARPRSRFREVMAVVLFRLLLLCAAFIVGVLHLFCFVVCTVVGFDLVQSWVGCVF